MRDVAYVPSNNRTQKSNGKNLLQSVGRSITNVWVQLQWFWYSTSTWFYPKTQTASVLVHSDSSKTLTTECKPGVQARALKLWVTTLGTHRYHQNILQPFLSTFWKSCHSNEKDQVYGLHDRLATSWTKTQHQHWMWKNIFIWIQSHSVIKSISQGLKIIEKVSFYNITSYVYWQNIWIS